MSERKDTAPSELLEKAIRELAEQSYPGKRVDLVRHTYDGESGIWNETGSRVIQAAAAESDEEDAQAGHEVQVRGYIRVWNKEDSKVTCSYIPVPVGFEHDWERHKESNGKLDRTLSEGWKQRDLKKWGTGS